jgi:hypothetical protein
MGIGGLLWLNTTVAAGLDPYSAGTIGYDFSYPQCGVSAPAAHFGIAGVNAGYPFTFYNSCLATEYASAARTGNASLYVNTGYDPTYTAIDGRHTTQECATKAQSLNATPDQQAAWSVGCSEAQRDIAYATSQSATSPAAWWLDVETSNSWSTADLSLNRYTIEGIVDTLRPQGRPIGVYSTWLQWSAITGGFQVQVDADWVATDQRSLRRARASCGAQGFTGAPVWLVQYVTTIDNDYAC